MRRLIAVATAAAMLSGCNTPYNNMKTGERLATFRQECIAAGYGANADLCAVETNKRFEQQRNRQIAAGVAIVALGAAAVAIASKGGGGAYDPPYRGNCRYNWQRAADGSRCGYRSAWARPGGY